MNDIRIDLFYSSSPIFSVEDSTYSEDVKTFFLLFAKFWAENRTSADVVIFFSFFALHLILGGKLVSCLFALICVGSAFCNNKLLNLGVRDLKKVENHCTRPTGRCVLVFIAVLY